MGIARLYVAGTPYNASELRDTNFEQSANVMYFAHIDHVPQKLTRASHTNWNFSPVTFGPTLLAPASPSAAATQPNTTGSFPIAQSYVVTAISDTLGQESRASAVATCTNDLTLRGNFNTVSWSAAASADRYAIYKSESGAGSDYGYIGTTTATSFADHNISADLADTPPKATNPFASAGNYPSTVTFFQQRLLFGRTRNKPNGVFGSQTADFENMDVSRPAKADDAISFALVSSRVNAVNQLSSIKGLLALTSDAIFSVGAGNSLYSSSVTSPVTPSTIVSIRQSGRGSSRLRPIGIDEVVLFKPSLGTSIRTVGYTFEIDGYKSNNIAIFSPHFFEGYDIIAWDYQQEPYSCVWAARSDGKLLCLAWEQEQQVWGWSLCETSGKVEDVCVITEGGQDRLYLAVRRTLAGREDVFIERMALPLIAEGDLNSACHLDCAVTQIFSTPTTTVGQLFHLEGETVTAFHDGYVTTGLVVRNAKVTLPHEGTTVTVGLPYQGEIETLTPALAQGTQHVARQMTGVVTIRLQYTRGITVGAGGGGSMFEVKQRQGEPIGSPIELKTGDYIINLGAKWNNASTIRVLQTYPLPATITAIFPETNITG